MEEFKRLKRAKKPPVPGDIFTFQFVRKPDAYFFGRVVRNDVVLVGEKYLLIYFYRDSAATPIPPKSLPLQNLVVPPVLTGDIFWTKAGYFEVVEQRNLEGQEVLSQHIFHDFIRNRYCTADGANVPKPVEDRFIGKYSLATDVGLEKQLMKPLIGIDHPASRR